MNLIYFIILHLILVPIFLSLLLKGERKRTTINSKGLFFDDNFSNHFLKHYSDLPLEVDTTVTPNTELWKEIKVKQKEHYIKTYFPETENMALLVGIRNGRKGGK